ncbi:cytochrome b/b6 domain-containing protein [Phenylobacterium terrae]|uniref:Cytochrome b/b6 domain-containing protein n=1 Tax=Phenylobacterium terrae TaxID=2665495 RepID=A0ABW4N008_9CAUL
MAEGDADDKIRVRLWDGPTRLIHWALVVLVGVSWWTHEIGRMDWHRWSGYTVLALLVFRIFWGFAGGTTARFASFLKGPGAVAAYARTLFKPGSAALPGHNPLGGWSVLAMLLALVCQVTFGLFAVDVDGIESGPFSQYVSFDLGRRFAEWHELSFNILLALIALHILAVVFYLVVKRDNLIAAMVTGRRLMASEPKEIRFAPWWMAVVGIAIAAVVAYVVMKGGRL